MNFFRKPRPSQSTSNSNVPQHASSAQSSGMSSSSGPGSTMQPCSQQTQSYSYNSSANWTPSYWGNSGGNSSTNAMIPCEVQTLALDFVHGSKTKNVTVSSLRRLEHVSTTVPYAYKSHLRGGYDLIVELLAPVQETKTTYYREKRTTSTSNTDEHKPVKVTAKAIPKSTCGGTHPALVATGGSINENKPKGPINFDLFTDPPSGIVASSRWGRLWPFNADRSQEIMVKADSCGVNGTGQAIKDLAVLLKVMPDEKWRITLGLGTYMSGKGSVASKRKTGPDKNQSGIVYTKAFKKKGIENKSSETYVAKSEFAQSSSYSETTGVIWKSTETVKYSDSTWGEEKLKYEEENSASKIKIERTVGGQTSEFDAGEVINGVIKALEAIEDISKLFDGIPKVGWSISPSFKFLTGQAYLEWGNRWPRSFSEENRVYYIERYVSLGGSVELASGKLEVFFGVEIDPWWLDVYFVAKIYLEVTAKVSISPSATVSFTNWEHRNLDMNPIDLNAKASATAELGATTGGRAFGYELRATLKLEGGVTFKVDGKISRNGPEAKGTLKSDGVKLKGEVIVVGSRRKTYDFDPVVVMKSKKVFEDKVLL